MKLLKRLKNLWKLSEIELTPDNKEQLVNLSKPKRMAQIIRMDNPVKKILENEL